MKQPAPPKPSVTKKRNNSQTGADTAQPEAEQYPTRFAEVRVRLAGSGNPAHAEALNSLIKTLRAPPLRDTNPF